MLEYRIATAEDIELMMDSRLEMLKEVNDLAPDHEYDTDFVDQSRKYFLDGDHTTVLVIDNGRVIACASMCYIGIMNTDLKLFRGACESVLNQTIGIDSIEWIIVVPFTWNVLEYFEYLENHYMEIVDQIRTGNVFANKMSKELLDRQKAQFTADPKRADELEAVFAEGFDKPVIRKIWPRFKKIVAVGTFPFRICTDELKRYADDDIIFDNGYYTASEAVIGRSMGPGSDEYILLTDHDLFEFLPAGTEPSSASLLQAKDVVPGSDYEVFVTNTAGLYRYRLGDIIHIGRMKDSVPVFTYLRRYYEVCTVGSTTLGLNGFEQVIPELEKLSGIGIHDYCIEADKELNAFRLMIEMSPVEGSRGGNSDPDMVKLSEMAENVFCGKFEDYARARAAWEIAPVTVNLLEPGTQLLYRDKCAISRKCSEEQLKPVRILDTEEKSRFFHAFIVK